jgi:acetyl-CoA C-acetyltransferase
LKGAAAITGYAEMKPQRRSGSHTPATICAELARQSVADAGLERAQIDGLLTATPFSNHNILWPSYLCEYLNIRPRYFDTVDIGGASAAGMVWRAAAAIQAGMCNHVLCVTAEVMDSGFFARLAHLMPHSDLEFEIPYGNVPANAGYAMVAMRHMHEYGTTSRQLAKVAVDQRCNAQANPDALFYGTPMSIEDVLNSRVVMEPLHLFEIVSPCTGGAAVIVSRADLAARGPHRPVTLLGAGEAGTNVSITNAPSLTSSWIEVAASHAFAMAGVTPQQMQFVQPYDCYTITVAITFEDMGFA